jgi:putative copper export protein
MARYSWGEGMKIAETEAWRTKGKKHSTLFVYGRFIPWALGAVVLGALGYGVKWAWDRLAGALGSPATDTPAGTVAHSGTPGWVWIGLVVLIVATVAAVAARDRPSRFLTVVLAAGALLTAWIGFGAFALGAIG